MKHSAAGTRGALPQSSDRLVRAAVRAEPCSNGRMALELEFTNFNSTMSLSLHVQAPALPVFNATVGKTATASIMQTPRAH